MKITLCIIFLLILAFFGYRISFKKFKVPLTAQHFFLTGIEYILVGIILGQAGLGVLSTETLQSLQPLFALTLGWIGMLFGMQMDLRLLRQFPAGYSRFSLIQAAITFLMIYLPMYVLIGKTMAPDIDSAHWGAMIIAAAGSCTAQSSLALLQKEFRLTRSRLMMLLRYTSSIDAAFAITACGVVGAFSTRGKLMAVPLHHGIQWFLISIFLGVSTGIMLDLVLTPTTRQSTLSVILIGFIAFISGIAYFLHLPILFITAMTGFVVANTQEARRSFAFLATLEKPVYILLLVFAGASFPHYASVDLLLIGSYVVIRFAGKSVGGAAGLMLVRLPLRFPRQIGSALIAEGGIALAIILSYQWMNPGPVSDILLVIVSSSIFINELLVPSTTRLVLRSAGKI